MRRGIFLILAALCAAYGGSIRMLRSGSRFFMIWFVLAAFFLVLFGCAGFGVWGRLPGPVKGLLWLLLLTAAGLVCVTEGLALRHFRDRGEPGLDVIIVLGAQVWPEGPSLSLKYRLDTAAAYLTENPETVCIVSGGQGANEPWTEAQGMRDYLTAHGIPEERIVCEDRSTNTVENIRFSMELMPLAGKRVGIVTNNFHVFRSVAIARKQGLADVCGIAAPSTAFYLPNNLFREVFGITKDALWGNL